jgi:hypothetical protein
MKQKERLFLAAIIASIAIAIFYSAYKSIDQYTKKRFDLCPLCNESIIVKI